MALLNDEEKPDPGKWFKSFFQPIPWLKDLRTYAGLVIIVFVGFTIYRAFFMPTNKQAQNTQIKVESGATLNLQQNQKQEIKKRAWWIPSPFVEGYSFVETTGRAGLGVRVGARLEF